MRAAWMLCLVGCGFEPVRATGDATVPNTWPCGAMPAAPPATLVMTGNGGQTSVTLSTIDVMGMGQLAVVPASTPMRVRLHFAITDTACAGSCVDQIELGWAPGDRAGCVFDKGVSKSSGATGDVDDMTLTVPSVPGGYDLRANIGQNFSCMYNGATSWWGGAPGDARTIARLCVR